MDIMEFKKELFLYIIFGFVSSAFNIGPYLFLTEVLHVNYLISNSISWTLSVFVAFITNKLWVFESKHNFIKEIIMFYSARIFTGILDMVLMYTCIEILSLENTLSKFGVLTIVIVLNYIFSKLVIFKK